MTGTSVKSGQGGWFYASYLHAVRPDLFPVIPGAAAEQTIRVGGNRGYPPYEFPDKNGEATGFTVDLLRAIADVMGLTVEIKVGEWAKMHDDLVTGSST